ncbi:hypothetical protein BRADI_4g30364v3 [Brachypodium distachyon]|uniref:Uncharacterized protein n=1 Tax=Brachypodium distachyon TaxID=15368 RepID=A0A2K2CRC1_BRADI|nr:hypothetical protein BRADI_4g30364v3 [Brachypodium distachyon]
MVFTMASSSWMRPQARSRPFVPATSGRNTRDVEEGEEKGREEDGQNTLPPPKPGWPAAAAGEAEVA